MHGHSGGVIPGPISNPEVKTSCVDSCTVVREPTGTIVAVPSFFLEYWKQCFIPAKNYSFSPYEEKYGVVDWEFLLVIFWATAKWAFTFL